MHCMALHPLNILWSHFIQTFPSQSSSTSMALSSQAFISKMFVTCYFFNPFIKLSLNPIPLCAQIKTLLLWLRFQDHLKILDLFKPLFSKLLPVQGSLSMSQELLQPPGPTTSKFHCFPYIFIFSVCYTYYKHPNTLLWDSEMNSAPK